MNRVIHVIILGSIIFFVLYLFGVEITNWYIILPGYLIAFILSTIISPRGENASIVKFGFRGSSKEGDDFTTQFNVAFDIGIGKKAELAGIITSKFELTKDDVLSIISTTKKNQISSGLKELKGAPALFSMYFDIEYDFNGKKIVIGYRPVKELNFMIGGVYEDSE